MPDDSVIGVDGCPGGWIAVHSSGDFRLFEDFSSLTRWHLESTMYVDIPMGLPNAAPRTVEAAARNLLKDRRSSVFSIPSRDAVYADDYKGACDINEQRFGKRLSLQAWHICRKIREADQALIHEPALVNRVYESHPELAFQQLNGGEPLVHAKKSVNGIEERLDLLSRYLPDAENRYNEILAGYLRKVVGRDDIVDALVLMALARLPKTTLVDDAGVDERGIPIRMIVPQQYRGPAESAGVY